MRIRHKWVILFMLAMLLIMSTLAFSETNNPSIISDGVDWDFGFVPFDYDLVHYYDIKNDGSANLYITNIATSCDCTHARAIDTLILPGNQTKIKAEFSTKNYYGKNTRTIALSTNDPVNPTFDLEFVSLIGALPKFAEAVPNALFFLPAHKDKDLKLLNKSANDIDVVITLEPDSIVTVDKLNLNIEAGGSAIVKVTPSGDLNAGTFLSSFAVDFGTTPPVRITVPVKIVRY